MGQMERLVKHSAALALLTFSCNVKEETITAQQPLTQTRWHADAGSQNDPHKLIWWQLTVPGWSHSLLSLWQAEREREKQGGRCHCKPSGNEAPTNRSLLLLEAQCASVSLTHTNTPDCARAHTQTHTHTHTQCLLGRAESSGCSSQWFDWFPRGSSFSKWGWFLMPPTHNHCHTQAVSRC